MSQGVIISGGMGGCREPSIEVLTSKAEKKDRHQAKSLLRRASTAARKGNLDRSLKLRHLAAELIGEDEVDVICEQERLSFAPAPIVQPMPPRQVLRGFASA